MWKNKLKIRNEHFFLALITLAILGAGARDLWLLNQFSKGNNTFIAYQNLEQHYTALLRDFYRLESFMNQVDDQEFTLTKNSALFYANNSLDLIMKADVILQELKPIYKNANLIDFEEAKGDFQKYILLLENSAANLIEIQALNVKIGNNLDKINDQLVVLADEMQGKQEAGSRVSMGITIILMVSSILLVFFYVNWQDRKTRFSRIHITRKLSLLASGNAIEESTEKISEELKLIDEKIMDVAEKYRKWNLSVEALSKEDFIRAKEYFPFDRNSFLGRSYIGFVDKIFAKEEELKLERSKIDWQLRINDALSELEREMRENVNSEKLYSLILQKIIKFININQGGFFVVQKDRNQQEVLKLEAAYAYNSERLLKKEMPMNEGLLGTCAREQQMIVLNEVPANYIEITSGLGEKNPQYLILQPIVYQKKTIGVIELASFYSFNEQIINYLNEASAIIALFLMNRQKDEQSVLDFFMVKNSNLAEDLTDDDLVLLNQKLTNWFNTTLPVAVFDKSGKLITFNHQFADIMPQKMITNSTAWHDIVSETSFSEELFQTDDSATRVFIKSLEVSDLVFYKINCTMSDGITNIIFATNYNKVD